MYIPRPTKMKIVPFTRDNIEQYTKQLEANFVLPGLSRKKTGMIYGPPNIGKSYFLQSLAYEVSTAKPLVGLIDTKKASPQKVLFICQEDRIEGFMSRASVQTQFQGYFGDREMELLAENLSLSVLPNALISRTLHDPISTQQVNELIEEASCYDLMIIDTARKVMGNCREVEEDKLLETALDAVAENADVAILLSHHITKLQADRNQSTKVFLNATGGSGLTSTQATSKYHLALFYGDSELECKLWHSKDNFVPRHKKIKESNPITFKHNELQLFINPDIGRNDDHPAASEVESSISSKQPVQHREIQPIEITDKQNDTDRHEEESALSQVESITANDSYESTVEKPLFETDPNILIQQQEVVTDKKLEKMVSKRNDRNKNGGIEVKHIESDSPETDQELGLFRPTQDNNY